jgi:hypothetical protein
VTAPAYTQEFAGHTPGPWTVTEWERDNGGTDWMVWGPKGSNHLGEPEIQGEYGSEADARLIAAAPSLLSERDSLKREVEELRGALREVLSLAEGAHEPSHSEAEELINGIAQSARAALSRGAA